MFKLYLSSLTSDVIERYKELKPQSELNVLVSYAYKGPDSYKIFKDFQENDLISSVILDSGTFTANMSKSGNFQIDFDGFLAYAKTFNEYFDYIFNYDTDFAEKGFFTNYEFQKKAETEGVQLVPVVHDYLDQYKEVQEYIDEKYPIIALGYHKKNKILKNIKQQAAKIKSNGLKVHLLGVSDFKILKQVNLDFADTSNWAQGPKFGSVYYFNSSTTDSFDIINFIDNSANKKTINLINNYKYRDKFLKYTTEDLGLKYSDLIGHHKNQNRQIVCIDHFIKMQDKLREHYELTFTQKDAAQQDP